MGDEKHEIEYLCLVLLFCLLLQECKIEDHQDGFERKKMSVFGAHIDRCVIPNLVFTVKCVPEKGHLIIGKLLINFVSSRKITICQLYCLLDHAWSFYLENHPVIFNMITSKLYSCSYKVVDHFNFVFFQNHNEPNVTAICLFWTEGPLTITL